MRRTPSSREQGICRRIDDDLQAFSNGATTVTLPGRGRPRAPAGGSTAVVIYYASLEATGSRCGWPAANRKTRPPRPTSRAQYRSSWAAHPTSAMSRENTPTSPHTPRPPTPRATLTSLVRRQWPGWRYASFLASLFALLVSAATLGTLTFSSLVKPGSAAANALATWEVTLTPNWVSPHDGAASNYQGVWVYPKSPTTPYRSPDSACQSPLPAARPAATDSDGRVGQDDWWFVIERNWPRFRPEPRTADWGASGQLPQRCAAMSAGIPAAASRLSRSTGCSAPGAAIHARVPRRWQAALLADADARHVPYLRRPVRRRPHRRHHRAPRGAHGLGRRSGHARHRPQQHQHPPALQRRHPKMDAALGRRLHPRTSPIRPTQSFVLTRIGGTLAEALADRPVATGSNAAGQFYTGTGTNLGAPTRTRSRPAPPTKPSSPQASTALGHRRRHPTRRQPRNPPELPPYLRGPRLPLRRPNPNGAGGGDP